MNAQGERLWDLAHSAAAGDAAAQAEFAYQIQPVLRRWLRRHWSHSPMRAFAEDAMQETLLECLRPGGALGRAAPGKGKGLFAFLRGIARHVADRFERAEARRAARLQHGADLASVATRERDPGERVDRRWARSQVRQAAELLAREEGADGPLVAFLRLYFVDGLPVRAVAARWGARRERVHELRRRACARFRKCLERVVGGEAEARDCCAAATTGCCAQSAQQ
jgi:RNA polymerase sigma factor (sigma-70 family)